MKTELCEQHLWAGGGGMDEGQKGGRAAVGYVEIFPDALKETHSSLIEGMPPCKTFQ